MRMLIEQRIEVDAPRELVYEVFSDIPNAADMLDAVTDIEVLSDGAFGEGFRWRETRVLFGKQATEEMWVTLSDPARHMKVEAQSHGTRYLSDYEFSDAGGGATEVRLSFTAVPVNWKSKLMSPLSIVFKRASEKAFWKDLEQLKAVCERRARAGA